MRTPSTIGAIQAFKIFASTIPCLQWVANAEIEVGTIIAQEVPMHSCMRTSSATESNPNTSYRTGTMMVPPPIPNRPARNPVKPPATSNVAASSSN